MKRNEYYFYWNSNIEYEILNTIYMKLKPVKLMLVFRTFFKLTVMGIT